ncbi:MAG: SctF chaperone SctG [Verrucomicrobia bacterium]|nr:SctF chaperone SctG [Verrucomicrobiota bacterium]
MSHTLSHFKEDFYLLLEAGFIAVNSADEDSAVKLFRASELLSPENTLPKIGFGYVHLCKLELKQASAIFRDVISKEPENEMAKTFLGICMSLMPTELAKGEKLLSEAAENSKDQGIKDLANTAINFVDTYVKKAPSPVDPQKKKH